MRPNVSSGRAPVRQHGRRATVRPPNSRPPPVAGVMMQDGSVNTPWQRYVALGDSLTEGLEDTNADGSYRGWADRLAQHLADRNGAPVEYANFAIRGRP